MAVIQMQPSELKAALDQGRELVLLDVREPAELDIVRFPGTLDIPMHQIPSREARELDPDRPVVVICHHGVRSMAVASWLVERGFDEVYNLVGGVDLYALRISPSIGRY